VMNSDGSHLHEITNLPETTIEALSWSPDSSQLLFWANDIVHPAVPGFLQGAPFHIYEMTAEGGDIHQIAWSPGPPLIVSGWFTTPEEGEQVGGFDWGPDTIAVSLPFEGIHILSGVSDGSPPTRVPSNGGTMVSPSWSPDGVQLAFSWSDSGNRFVANGGTDPFQLYTANPSRPSEQSQQLTFDSADHVNPSWGPAPSSRTVRGVRPTVSVLEALERRSTTVRVLLTCPASAGRHGCLDVLLATLSSGAQSSKSYKLSAGKDRVVSLRLSKRLARSLGVGDKLALTLRARMRGKLSTVRQRPSVFAPASVGGTCQDPQVQLGSSVTLSGVLHVAPVGARTAAASSGIRVGMVARLNGGLSETVTGKTDRSGRYSLTFLPAEPGVWTMQVVWNGDRNHASAEGPECGALVTAPPPPEPQKTTLALNCPGKSELAMPLSISGELTPAIGGAPIKLTYTHQTQGPLQTFTETATTTSSGAFSDASVTPTDAGEWDVSAAYAGDAAHTASTAQSCAISVS
jgi:hypothetical protein